MIEPSLRLVCAPSCYTANDIVSQLLKTTHVTKDLSRGEEASLLTSQ